MAALFSYRKDRFSIGYQGECADHRQRRETNQGIEDVPDIENESADGVSPESSIMDPKVFVAVCRKADGDNVIVISSEPSGRILLEYGERWRIETLFGNLKTRGFRLEDTHLTDGARVSRLLSLLTLAGCWALLAGELESTITPIKIKNHGRAEKSVFRLGFETLRNYFCRIQMNSGQKQRFQRLTLLLSCTLEKD